MRPLSKAALGGSVLSVATVGALVVGGVFTTTATLIVADPFAPGATADSLTRFGSCASLRDWYVRHALKEVGPYGWGGPVMYATDGGWATGNDSLAAAEDAGTPTSSRASSATGTNTQEADVDEPDVAKTDGKRVVRLIDQRVLVVSDVTGEEPRELGRVSLPADAYGTELLLAGDHVLVSQAGGYWGDPMPTEDRVAPTGPGRVGGSRVIDVDISDPSDPTIVHDDLYTGRQVSLRLYGDVVRLVTATPRPELRWLMPDKGVSEDEATRHNRELVRRTAIEDWLPMVAEGSSGDPARLIDCTDVYHPAEWSGGETTTVTTYDVDEPAERRSVGVTADGQVVYSSANRLYVASTEINSPSVWRRMGSAVTGREVMPREQDVRTQLHAFSLAGTDTRYVASGHVTGAVRDRWSLDEHDGRLRVAWTRTGRNGHTQNGITVLSEKGSTLAATGTIDRLGLDENIQSVRWFDDLAVLVTFRQVDPLYTIDLTDQAHPREIGQLKIPGYSGYLHPIGDDLLLGLGVDATDQGQAVGSQAAVFDISDLADPRRVSQQRFGPSSLPAMEDPRGFTWLPDRRTGLTTVASWTGEGSSRLVAIHVGEGGAMQARDLLTRVGWNVRTLPLDDGRVAVVDGQDLQVLDVG